MDHNSGYEKKDIPVRPVLIGGVIFILTVLGTIYMLYEYYIRVLDSTTYEFKLSKRSACLLYTSPSPRDLSTSRMPSSA